MSQWLLSQMCNSTYVLSYSRPIQLSLTTSNLSHITTFTGTQLIILVSQTPRGPRHPRPWILLADISLYAAQVWQQKGPSANSHLSRFFPRKLFIQFSVNKVQDFQIFVLHNCILIFDAEIFYLKPQAQATNFKTWMRVFHLQVALL